MSAKDDAAALVARLRECAAAGDRACDDDPPPGWIRLMKEAADEIESLDARLERMC